MTKEEKETINSLVDRIDKLEKFIKQNPEFTVSEPIKFPCELTLPSGKVATIRSFKAKDVVNMGRIASGQPDLLCAALISGLVSIEGETMPIAEQIMEDMDGIDYLRFAGFFKQVGFL